MAQIQDRLHIAEEDALNDSDLSVDDDSGFPARVSLQSAMKQRSGSATNALNIQEFTSLLHQDGALTSLLSTAIFEVKIELKRGKAIFRKLLKRYADDLHEEIWNDDQKAVVAFLSSYSADITRKYFSELFASRYVQNRGNAEILQRSNPRLQPDRPPEVRTPEYDKGLAQQQQPESLKLMKLRQRGSSSGYWEIRKKCCNCQQGTDLIPNRHFACYICHHKIGDHCIDTEHWVATIDVELPLTWNPTVIQGYPESSKPVWHKTNDFRAPSENTRLKNTFEGAGEEASNHDSLWHLKKQERFILKSVAYQTFHRRLREFIYPTLQTRLQDLIAQWSRPDHRYCAQVTCYKLPALVAELQYIHPSRIHFEDHETATPHRWKTINYCQNEIERWTRETWDWWPLLPCLRTLDQGQARVRWQCTCGEDRWAEVPLPFAKRLNSIIRILPASNITIHGLPSLSSQQQISRDQSARDTGRAPNKTSNNQQGNTQRISTSSAKTMESESPSLESEATSTEGSDHRVLLIVKQGSDYKLAQICIQGLSCHTFFSTLRHHYFQLRGSLRRWFSVWRYSHCDFYMCEKFEDNEFTPKKRDAFPAVTNTDHEYQPKPIGVVPPISIHEFRKRFYACHQPNRYLHWYHKCRKLGLHSSELLERFPKKKSVFEQGGDKREDFWGIYAREHISFLGVLLYNLICLSPMLIFFIAWITPHGQSSDLQNPAVPLSMMIGMLSLFWSTYLSTLQFGKEKGVEI